MSLAAKRWKKATTLVKLRNLAVDAFKVLPFNRFVLCSKFVIQFDLFFVVCPSWYGFRNFLCS